MAGVMTPYIVRQGDYLAKLAFLRGFDADEVWGDPKNEELKKLRPDPNILAPGDILYVPEKKEGEGLPIEKGAENSYAATVPTADVELTFKDGKDPIANEPCDVQGLDGAATATDGDGKLKLKVPYTLREFSITIAGKDASFNVRLGDLDPLSEPSGVVGRLCNLGYLPADMSDATEDEVTEMLAIAVASFKQDQGKEPTGDLDDATRNAIGEAHGL